MSQLIQDGFLYSLFPDTKHINPEHYTQPDGSISLEKYPATNPYFRTDAIRCYYDISGGYGPTPRLVYYFLIIITMLGRRRGWIATAALGYIMLYSGTAAVHAVALAAVRTKLMPPNWRHNYEVVLVDGYSSGGIAKFNEYPHISVVQNQIWELWMPVLPMAWDLDVDPVLAIVGAAFFVLLPMHIWSQNLRQTRDRPIVIAWGVLLFIGMACALAAHYHSEFWPFTQLRFCPIGQQDELPLQNDGSQTYIDKWDGIDRYRWNKTVENYFINKSEPAYIGNKCMYPCFDMQRWPLRDPTDIKATVPSDSEPKFFGTDVWFFLLIAVFMLVCSTTISGLTIAALPYFPRSWTFSGHRTYLDTRTNQPLEFAAGLLQRIKSIRKNDTASVWMRAWYTILLGYFLMIYYYTYFVSPLALLFFLIIMEWLIWETDTGWETFRHVGQWSAIVGLGFLFIVEVMSQFMEKRDGNSQITTPSSQSNVLPFSQKESMATISSSTKHSRRASV